MDAAAGLVREAGEWKLSVARPCARAETAHVRSRTVVERWGEFAMVGRRPIGAGGETDLGTGADWHLICIQ